VTESTGRTVTQVKEHSYNEWWNLHVRDAKGEPLKPEEQAYYDAGVKVMDSHEQYPATLETLRELRVRVMALRKEEERLLAQQRAVEQRIADLEIQYHARTGHAVAAPGS